MIEPGTLSAFGDMTPRIEYSLFVTAGALERMEPRLRRHEEDFLGAFDAHRDLIFQTAAEVHSRHRKSRYVGADFGRFLKGNIEIWRTRHVLDLLSWGPPIRR